MSTLKAFEWEVHIDHPNTRLLTYHYEADVIELMPTGSKKDEAMLRKYESCLVMVT